MNGKLREATLKLVFRDDGNMELLGEMVLEFLGRQHRVVCDADEVISIHQAAVAALEEGVPAPANDGAPWEPPEEVVLGEALGAVGPPQPPPVPMGVPVRVGEGAPSPRRAPPVRHHVQKDEAGNPILPSGSGVNAGELLGATNPGENGVDLL